MASKPKLERYGGSKVRTGCVTCKARRVKCDEAKPSCLRCAKAGRLCGGYVAPPPKDRNAAGQPLMIISYVAPDTCITQWPDVGSREKRSLEFFRTRTLLEAFPDVAWQDDLLRTSSYDDAVRHAVIALAAIHEQYGGRSQMDSDFAMQEYSKAMKQVMKLDMKGSASTDVALISCILFACFESLQGHFRSSLLHVKSGLQILREQEESGVADAKVAYMKKRVLRPLFIRFVTQSREIGDSDIYLAYNTIPAIRGASINSLSSYDEAHASLAIFSHEFVIFLGSLKLDLPQDPFRLQAVIAQHAALTKRHAIWCEALDDLLKRGLVADESDIAKLQIWRIVIDMTLELNIALGETAWDRKIEMFRKLVNFAEVVVANQPTVHACSSPHKATSTQLSGPHLPGMNSSNQDNEESSVNDKSLSVVDHCQTISLLKPIFSLDFGIIPPLYIVISRCRDPAIRRRALQLLASCNRREGIWDSTLSARVGEKIIAIEEEGALSHPVLYASQIPEHARIRDLTTKFGADRQGLICYKKSVAFVGPNDQYEELLEW